MITKCPVEFLYDLVNGKNSKPSLQMTSFLVVSDNDCILATEEDSQFLGVARPLLNLRGVFSGFARGGNSFALTEADISRRVRRGRDTVILPSLTPSINAHWSQV